MAGDLNENTWKDKLKSKFPQFFKSVKVLDIGSADINGTNKPWFENSIYLGLDVAPYSNVDIVAVAHEYVAPAWSFDVVCSTSELEHDKYWQETLKKMVDLLRPGGFMWFAAAHNNSEHGTKEHGPLDSLTSELEDDWATYYKNMSVEDIKSVFDLEEVFSDHEIGYSQENNELSIYFWGIKK